MDFPSPEDAFSHDSRLVHTFLGGKSSVFLDAEANWKL